jgi:phosphatidylglycerophosphatase A
LVRSKDIAKSRLNMLNPWHLLATGFGSGLSPVVPGTMGSLAAIPFWYLMTFLPWQLYSLVVMMGICIGVYLPSHGERYGYPRSREHRLGRVCRDVDHLDGATDA